MNSKQVRKKLDNYFIKTHKIKVQENTQKTTVIRDQISESCLDTLRDLSEVVIVIKEIQPDKIGRILIKIISVL